MGQNKWGQCGIGERLCIYILESSLVVRYSLSSSLRTLISVIFLSISIFAPHLQDLVNLKYISIKLSFERLGSLTYQRIKGKKKLIDTNFATVDNHSKDHIYTPERVIIEDDIKDMDTGLNHCIAYSKCGSTVYTWGRGSDGQLGAGYFKTRPNPVKLNKFEGSIIGISAGFNHSAVITDFGYLYVWGKGMASVLKKSITSGIPRFSDDFVNSIF